MQLKPQLFIVGAPKAGTTALHAYFEKHPQLNMSSDKEPNYFSWHEIESQQLYYKKQNLSPKLNNTQQIILKLTMFDHIEFEHYL